MGVMSRRVIMVKAAKILVKDDNCSGRLTYLSFYCYILLFDCSNRIAANNIS